MNFYGQYPLRGRHKGRYKPGLWSGDRGGPNKIAMWPRLDPIFTTKVVKSKSQDKARKYIALDGGS